MKTLLTQTLTFEFEGELLEINLRIKIPREHLDSLITGHLQGMTEQFFKVKAIITRKEK